MKTRQGLKLSEEVGEVMRAPCRHMGVSRRPGTLEEVGDELADVVLSAYMPAHYLGSDLDAALARKSSAGYVRGWRESRPTEPPQMITDWNVPTLGACT